MEMAPVEKANIAIRPVPTPTPLPSPLPPRPEDGEDEIDEEEIKKKIEEIQKIIDSRTYVHQRSRAYIRNAPRTDFTATLLFNSALELEQKGSLLQAEQSFYLND